MPTGEPYRYCQDNRPKHNRTRQAQRVPMKEFQSTKYARPLKPSKLNPHLIRQHSVKRLNPPCRVLLCESIHCFRNSHFQVFTLKGRTVKSMFMKLWQVKPGGETSAVPGVFARRNVHKC